MNFETSRIGKSSKVKMQEFCFLKTSRFTGLWTSWYKQGPSGLSGIMASANRPCPIWSSDYSLSLGGIIRNVRVAYFSLNRLMGWMKSKRVINFLQEVAEEVKTTVGTTSIADLLAISLPTLYARNLDRKNTPVVKKRLFSFKTLDWKPTCFSSIAKSNDLISQPWRFWNFLQNFEVPLLQISHDRFALDKVGQRSQLLKTQGRFRSSLAILRITWMKKAWKQLK